MLGIIISELSSYTYDFRNSSRYLPTYTYDIPMYLYYSMVISMSEDNSSVGRYLGIPK